MSALATEAVVEELTSTLIPTVTRVDTRLEVSPVSVVLAVSIVFILSPITISGNSIILAAFYRYKRLRTASNCLLVSLAVSDFGVGVFMPYGIHLELSGTSENGISTPCIVPYCIVIALCSVSVLVTVAIAVDRLTSLAQPLRYKNIITHSSIEKYIAVFWTYAIIVGLSPLIYAQMMGITQPYSGTCRFGAAVLPPVRVFLVLAVWAPSALVLLGCYMYVYLVARAHAKAIYTAEYPFRNQTQTLALPRYGQTLAVTVGAFFILWLPFQTCMLLDIIFGTNMMSDWVVVWLGLPILGHSGANPWIYAFHHGEMRMAASKIAEDLVTLFGVTPSRYGCSPARRGSNSNVELGEVNNSNEERRKPAEDCFAAKHTVIYASRKCLEMSGKHIEISPESAVNMSSSDGYGQSDIVEGNIHDLTKMLDPKYIIDRNHVIDANHNIDKIKNLKYLLDPTFNKIRHLRKVNHKRLSVKNIARLHEPRFISYQHLEIDATGNRKGLRLNTMSEPVLSIDNPVNNKSFNNTLSRNEILAHRRNSSLSSLSDPNIKGAMGSSEINLRLLQTDKCQVVNHRYSVQNLNQNRNNEQNLARSAIHCQYLENQKKIFSLSPSRSRLSTKVLDSPSPTLDVRIENYSHTSLPSPNSRGSPVSRTSNRSVTITPNKLASFFQSELPRLPAYPEHRRDSIVKLRLTRTNLDILKHAESINTMEPMCDSKYLDPSNRIDCLLVPAIHSEPPSPIEPLPLNSLQEEDNSKNLINTQISSMPPLRPQVNNRNLKSPIRHSDPIIPSVLLNVEDYSDLQENSNEPLCNGWLDPSPTKECASVNPIELSELLLQYSERPKENRLPDTIFPEVNSTRYSSRRPSESKWSESSRSQEVLSNITEFQRIPSSYSVNNFQTCNSGSDLNDITSCLDPFMCSDALSSSLHESFFEVPSVPDSDIFTSFEDSYEPAPVNMNHNNGVLSSVSSTSLLRRPKIFDSDLQSKSTESMCRGREWNTEKLCTILRLESTIYRSRPRVRTCKDSRLAPLAMPTPTDVCTPTFDIVPDINNEGSLGVRV